MSVDTKKKEPVGNYKNAGREWHREGVPVQVRTHDFPDADLGKAIPYGIYDLTAESGWVMLQVLRSKGFFTLAGREHRNHRPPHRSAFATFKAHQCQQCS